MPRDKQTALLFKEANFAGCAKMRWPVLPKLAPKIRQSVDANAQKTLNFRNSYLLGDGCYNITAFVQIARLVRELHCTEMSCGDSELSAAGKGV